MWRWLGVALLLGGCAGPAFYYCHMVVLQRADGRNVDALECIPRSRQVPWDKNHPPGRDLFSDGDESRDVVLPF